MDPAARLAIDALHREAQTRAAERAEAERIAMRIAHEKAAKAADMQREQMQRWAEEARRARGG